MALRPLERDILVVVSRLAGDYGETDSDAVAAELVQMGHELPPKLVYHRLYGELKQAGYLKPITTISSERVMHVELDRLGRDEVEANTDAMEQVYSHARRLLDSDAFSQAYPGAFQPWAEAEELLFGDDPESQLATIGFKLRDATQAFATALVDEHKPPGSDTEVSHVKNRLKNVIRMYAPQLGNRRPAVLEAMVALWDADVDLIQKQTHGNEQGVTLTVNDGRRIVILTMFLMVEFATILDEIVQSPPATLEEAAHES